MSTVCLSVCPGGGGGIVALNAGFPSSFSPLIVGKSGELYFMQLKKAVKAGNEASGKVLSAV